MQDCYELTLLQASRKHHYIPCFYTKRWTGADGKLCVYSRPHKEVVTYRKYPTAVGYKDDLYTLTGLRPESRTVLEDKFFKIVDQRASDASDYMLNNQTTKVPGELRNAFTRLLIGFFHRTPDRVEEITEALAKELEPVLEGVIAEFRSGARGPVPTEVELEEIATNWRRDARTRMWGQSLARLVNSDMLGPAIVNMQWRVRRFRTLNYDLLTSDKPLIATNGFAHKEGHLVLPLGPRTLFIATNNNATTRAILSQSENQLARKANDQIVRQAKQFVYGVDDGQKSFVAARLQATTNR